VAWQRLDFQLLGSLGAMSKRHIYQEMLEKIYKKFSGLVENTVGEDEIEVVRKLFDRLKMLADFSSSFDYLTSLRQFISLE